MYSEINLQISKNRLEANVNLPATIDRVGRKANLALALAVFIRLSDDSSGSTRGAASRVVECDFSLGKCTTIVVWLGVPGEVLDEADLRTLDTASVGRQRVFSSVCSGTTDGVNDSTSPSCAANILDLDVVRVTVVGAGDADRATHSRAAISTVLAARVVRGATLDKGRKYEEKHPLAVGIRTALNSGVANGRVLERILVGIVEALLMRGVGNVVRESDLSEAVCRSLVKVPVVANEAICHGGSTGCGSGS